MASRKSRSVVKSTTVAPTETPVVVQPDGHTDAIKHEDAAALGTPQDAPQVAETPVEALPAGKPTNRVRFALKEGYRPDGKGALGGTRLKAHTHAFLNTSGLSAGGVVSSSLCRAIVGSTAMDHHKAKFETVASEFDDAGKVIKQGGTRLNAAGLTFFADRIAKEDKSMRSAYENMMVHGQPDGDIMKNASGIFQIA